MKLAAIGVIIIAVLIGLLAWNQISNGNDKTYAVIQQKLNDGALLIDVRTQEEYDAGHIEASTLLSLQDIENGSIPDTSKDTPLYIYCRSGNRSAEAARLLKGAGFTNITDLGGINEVTAMGGKSVLD